MTTFVGDARRRVVVRGRAVAGGARDGTLAVRVWLTFAYTNSGTSPTHVGFVVNRLEKDGRDRLPFGHRALTGTVIWVRLLST